MLDCYLFPLDTGSGDTTVMGYFDGNTVTGLWNYAQHFSMNDNSYSSTFGPSTVGVINLTSGQTKRGRADNEWNGRRGRRRQWFADCDWRSRSDWRCLLDPAGNQVQMESKNIGDLLTAANVTWGSFMGGFNWNKTNKNGTTGCLRSSTGLAGTTNDYIPHHSFFGYWATTANPNHTRPQSISEIGNAGPANHNYDTDDFFAAVKAGNFPAVNFLKAPGYEDGHAGYSDPLDEQRFLVETLNFLQQRTPGSRPPSSLCMTIPTVGMTTRWVRS